MDKSTIYNIVGAALAALVILVFGLLAGAAQKKESDETEEKSRSLVTKLNDEIKDLTRENAEKQKKRDDEIKSLTRENDEKQKQRNEEIKSIQTKANEEAVKQAEFARNAFSKQQESTEEIIRLTKQVSELSDETLSSIKSKDSFCFLSIGISPDVKQGETTSNAYLTLYHSGKYPVKNLSVSIINTDDEADDEHVNGESENASFSDEYKSSNPYNEHIPVVVPNQYLRLKPMKISLKKQKSFHIFFSSENDFWFQRVLLRKFNRDMSIRPYYASITQVYKQDFNPNLNHVYRFEVIIYESSSLSLEKKYDPNHGKFDLRAWGDFLTDKERQGKLWNWGTLHWNGYFLDQGNYMPPSYWKLEEKPKPN